MNIMKKKIPFIFVSLLICAALLCSCAQEQPDPKAIVGAWEYRNQVWCDFKEDGTCSIGGTTGTYSVSDDMVLTMTPKGGDKQTFEWAGSKDKVTTENWFIGDDTLYVNGGVYPRIEDSGDSSETTASNDSASVASSENSSNS